MHGDKFTGWHGAFAQAFVHADTATPCSKDHLGMGSVCGGGDPSNEAPSHFSTDADFANLLYVANFDSEWTRMPTTVITDHSLTGPHANEASAGQTTRCIPSYPGPFRNLLTPNLTPSAENIRQSDTCVAEQTPPKFSDASHHEHGNLHKALAARSDLVPKSTDTQPQKNEKGARPRIWSTRRKYSTKCKSVDVGYDKWQDRDRCIARAAHNVTEQRYRLNINDKLEALCDSVPTLRIVSKAEKGEDITEELATLNGLTPAYKLNKAMVLSKAIEYMRHLQEQHDKLWSENRALRRRIEGLNRPHEIGVSDATIEALASPNILMP